MDHQGHTHKEETQVTLNVEGMTCAHCAMAVTKVLKKNNAIHPHVNFSTGEAIFSVHDKNDIPEIIKGIQRAGYKVLSRKEIESHQNGISAVEQKFLFTLPFTLPLFFSHMIFSHDFVLNNPIVQMILCLPVFFIGSAYFGKSAWNSLKVAAPNMNVLIMIGSGAAFAYSISGIILFYGSSSAHDYLFFETTATIITLVLLGNVLEHRSVKQTTSAISELSKMQNVIAKRVENHNGKELINEVSQKEINVGDVLLVNMGDSIPVDGLILSGATSIDESMITGESMPVEKNIGDKLIGGTIVSSGNLRMLAERVGQETVLSKIIEMVKSAQQKKPTIQKLGDTVSTIFVPIVIGISILTFFLCHDLFEISFQQSLMNSVAVLVISCPCAMGLATPTAVMVGIGRAAKNGILIKGGSTLEEFAKITKIVFDKTGTLTTGNFRIKKITALNNTRLEEVKSILFYLEQRSSHPIAKSMVSSLKNESHAPISFAEINEVKGIGINAKDASGNFFELGSYRIAKELTDDSWHTIYILKNKILVGYADLEDEIKQNAKETISFLNSQGILPVLLSGDIKSRCETIATQLGISEIYCEQTPSDKIKFIESLSKDEKVAMVGDGINDAPALAKASVGISIGNATQVAIQSSQIILLNEKDLYQLVLAFQISRKTLLTIKQNLFWAFFYNVVAIPIAAAGFLSPMIGALSMAFSDVMVIGNSLLLKIKSVKS